MEIHLLGPLEVERQGRVVETGTPQALLATGRAKPDERIDTENGVYTLEGRTITDVHAEKSMTLTEVIRYSSNIGIAKFTSRLTPREEYEVLRDLGFGLATPEAQSAAGTPEATTA